MGRSAWRLAHPLRWAFNAAIVFYKSSACHGTHMDQDIHYYLDGVVGILFLLYTSTIGDIPLLSSLLIVWLRLGQHRLAQDLGHS